MASYPSNKIKYLLAKGLIDFSAHSFKIILMKSGFTFDPEVDGYADVSTNELAAGNGYATGGQALKGVVVTEDPTTDRTNITWTNASWTATPGSIGPTPGAIVFDDTVTTPTADPIVGYINFGGEQTQVAGGIATISNIEFRIA